MTLLHSDGNGWDPVSVPPVGNVLSGVWVSGSEVYAVGDDGIALYRSGASGLLAEPTPAGWYLKRVWSGSSRVLAVGSGRVLTRQ
jgi:hypothetical protein